MDVSPVCGQNSRDRWDNEYCKEREKNENPFFKSDYFIEYIRHIFQTRCRSSLLAKIDLSISYRYD